MESVGWSIRHGLEIALELTGAERTDYRQVVLEQRLRDALARLSPAFPAEALEDAYRKLTRPAGPTLEARNRAFHRMLVDCVTVEHRTDEGAIRGVQVQVLDFENADHDHWLAVNQFTVAEDRHTRRPDVVLFVNGFPLAVIELKNPADENATLWSAFQQLQTCQAQIPALFATNAALVVSDGVQARIGTLGAGKEWFKPWRTNSGRVDAAPNLAELQDRRGRFKELSTHGAEGPIEIELRYRETATIASIKSISKNTRQPPVTFIYPGQERKVDTMAVFT